jgi:hypothetical protein
MNEFSYGNRDAPSVFEPVNVVDVVDGVGEVASIPDHLAYTGNLAPISTQFLRRDSPYQNFGASGGAGSPGRAASAPMEYLLYSGNLPVISKQFYRAGECA